MVVFPRKTGKRASCDAGDGQECTGAPAYSLAPSPAQRREKRRETPKEKADIRDAALQGRAPRGFSIAVNPANEAPELYFSPRIQPWP
jgi:hypothetical protein